MSDTPTPAQMQPGYRSLPHAPAETPETMRRMAERVESGSDLSRRCADMLRHGAEALETLKAVNEELHRERECRVRNQDALLARDWQPIETAPRDGSAILGYGRHSGPQPDAQRTGDHWWAMLWDIWRSSDGGGERWVFAKDGKPTWSAPTHWMPLPLAPTREGR